MCSELEEGIQSRRVSPVGSEAPAGSMVTGWRKEPQMEDSASGRKNGTPLALHDQRSVRTAGHTQRHTYMHMVCM